MEELYPKIEQADPTLPEKREKTAYSYDNAGYLSAGEEVDKDGDTLRKTTDLYQENG